MCFECDSSAYLKNGNCTVCTEIDPNCNTCSIKNNMPTCETCAYGYGLDGDNKC